MLFSSLLKVLGKHDHNIKREKELKNELVLKKFTFHSTQVQFDPGTWKNSIKDFWIPTPSLISNLNNWKSKVVPEGGKECEKSDQEWLCEGCGKSLWLFNIFMNCFERGKSEERERGTNG